MVPIPQDDDIPFCAEDCEFLDPKEIALAVTYNPTTKKPVGIFKDHNKHICKRFNVEVVHGPHHPNIIAHKDCLIAVLHELRRKPTLADLMYEYYKTRKIKF